MRRKAPKLITYRGATYKRVSADELGAEKSYFVYPLSLSSNIVEVTAGSPEEAKQKVWNGEGREVVEFRSTAVPTEDWYAMENPGNRPSGAMGYKMLHQLLGDKIQVKPSK